MFKSLALAVVAITVLAPVWAADPPADPPEAPSAADIDKLMTQFRTDLQAARADVVAKGITLSSEQAAKFWPLFQQFQKEQSAIIDAQLKSTQQYADNFAKLTEAGSLEYITSLLERDEKIHGLRVKWLAKFQSAVPIGTAARVIQIDRRLGIVAQIQLASKVPLVR
ncbi:MAG TPA: hypothetical protein VEW08_02110 [Steroidobacteraceae bacterium]|nr:hypothetical protein [Steroidobacteraceae bacterium]